MKKQAKSPPQTSKAKPGIGIKEIAEKLNISIGTVDRALHGRPGISPQTAAKVLRTAETLGYKPNVAARLLKLNRRLVISIHLPDEIAFFFDLVRNAIIEAARPFSSNIELRFRHYPRLDEGELEAFQLAMRERVDGIIIAPGNPRKLQRLIREADQKGIPVVCVATDAPGTERLASVSADPHVSGAMAAEMLTRCTRQPGPVLVITGNLGVVDHSEKLRGFAERLSTMKSPLSLVPVLEAHDHPSEADQKTREALARYPDIIAVYVTTANSLPVIDALERTGHLGRVSIVATDLFPALASEIRKGTVLASIYQRPLAQGRVAFEELYRYLTEHRAPTRIHNLPPHLVMQSNLDLFMDIVASGFETAEESGWEKLTGYASS